ncbi:MAG: TIGR00282 family metallophosphoesterase [Clostridia bacterium]|nr:TIGR00282 family metallophosphoesterase [Clostridia bacterium]
MNILIIGDIIGNSGVNKVKSILPNVVKEKNIDFVIANAENSADGIGITSKIFNDLITRGVNVVTMGNHTWGKKDIFNIIDDKKLLRPANYTDNVPGNGYGIYEVKGKKIAVINLIGRASMNVLSDNPFVKAEELVNKIKNEVDYIIIDFHAEATAEKIAMGYFLDGKVTCVFGTHTHVATADEEILENGTAYITDIGMTGPKKSVIGMDVEASIKRFVTTLPEKYKVSQDSKIILSGIVLEVNDEKSRAEKITRIKL